MLPRKYIFHVITFTLIADLWPWSNADIFTSTAKMESLLDTRRQVISDLEDYLHQEDDRLHHLRLYLDLYKREQEKALQDVPSYVGNPINAFTLIKRLSLDLEDIKRRTKKITDFGKAAQTNNNATISYTSLVDMEGAGVALRRLQRMYKLKIEDIAQGVLKGVIFNLPMTAGDCNELGDVLYKMKDYKSALAWQMEALRKYRLEKDIPHVVDEIDLMEYIAIVHYRLGDFETASEWTMKILNIDPDNQRAKTNLVTFEQSILELNTPTPKALSKTEEQIQDQSVKKNTFAEAKNTTHSQITSKTETLHKTSDENKSENIKQHDDSKVDTTQEKTKSRDANEIKRSDENVIEIIGENKIESDDENKSDVEDKSYTTTTNTGQIKTTSEKETKSIDENKLEARSNNITDTNSDSNIDAKNLTSNESNAKNITSNRVIVSNETSDSGETDIEVTETEEERIRRIEDGIIDFRRDMFMNDALCRGEYEIAPEMSSRLFCRYRNDAPFLKLAPIKMEQKYIEPDVFLFYDVISNDEIQHVKGQAMPNFQRARVGSGSNTSTVANYRISQSSWLKDSVSHVIARLTRRVGDFTGLSMTYAEELQASNYGVGGHYDPHLDYAPDKNLKRLRIATVMFYLSEVAQGGATVFPKLGLSVFPVKGAAIFWYNLQRSTEGNRNTRHAACPVLEGSKWVANKWIRLPGHEFIRPCLLEHQREDVIPNVPAPVIKPEAQEYLDMELSQF